GFPPRTRTQLGQFRRRPQPGHTWDAILPSRRRYRGERLQLLLVRIGDLHPTQPVTAARLLRHLGDDQRWSSPFCFLQTGSSDPTPTPPITLNESCFCCLTGFHVDLRESCYTWYESTMTPIPFYKLTRSGGGWNTQISTISLGK